MPMTKYADAESAKVLTPEEHKEVESKLHSLGKTSAQELSATQREKVFREGVQGQA